MPGLPKVEVNDESAKRGEQWTTARIRIAVDELGIRHDEYAYDACIGVGLGRELVGDELGKKKTDLECVWPATALHSRAECAQFEPYDYDNPDGSQAVSVCPLLSHV